ncbi:MAG TPA: DEAD/DEAH box helicase [Rectinemataceae bacterium]|nr:DEAD/DEAH box helicase [Rectinemataceae bacterium]
MLFSCLVDADFLDTENYMTPGASLIRSEDSIDLAQAKRLLDKRLDELARTAADTPVNRARQEILAECRAASRLPPGLFSLTVPTGGGKTLAGMAFALEHALAHGKRRVVVAIPYTSIIEQTAEIYRSVFGDEAVIEHHSNLDPDRETPRSKLATENWDAPIIVTTNVQLFESLFASRTSACRKLHNLADSVIILDEAQILPVGYLEPLVEAMKGLISLFGVSLVFSTATQPALAGKLQSGLARLTGFAKGSLREIISDPAALAGRLRRVELVPYRGDDEPVAWEDLAPEIASHNQVLCVVNTRSDCRDLHALLPAGTIHLSALMCPEHRSEVIARIKEDLRKGRPIRVVSTQLVEAGVDIDFPIVYRALAGLDSIAQAAGRCNREGRLGSDGRFGKVVVFTPPRPAPPGMLRKGQDAAKEMFRLHAKDATQLAPEAFDTYFRLFYGKANSFDEKGIMELLAGPDVDEAKIQFRSAAAKFSLIDDGGQRTVIVNFSSKRSMENPRLSSQALASHIETFGPDRATLRRLQRYSVNVPQRVFDALLEAGSIRQIKNLEGLYIQSLPGLYDETFGLRLEGPKLSPLDFIA